ncbi:hypothetical protein [uncultured Maritimibacter sp.]|uniref:hypothetical protein n=1 Tax=uncultured Maritimibacter sp. TaxID=991866 RepID=UPI0025962822|nr:hypothetical protein [uncultured Maritimibacter sp.]
MWSLVGVFFAAAFAVNAIPHFVAGVQGRAFPSPFASPPGVGMSAPPVNVLWGAANALAAWALFCPVAGFDPARTGHLIAGAAGGLVMALLLSRHFGRVMKEAGRD